MPTTYTATRNASENPPTGLKPPQRPQSSTIGSSIPVPASSISTENTSSRKSLLPQRAAARTRLPGLTKPQIPTRTQPQPQPTRNTETNQRQTTKKSDIIREEQKQQQDKPAVETQAVAVAPSEPPPPEPIHAAAAERPIELPEPVKAPTATTASTNRPPSRPRIERIATRSKSPVKKQQNDVNPTAAKKPSMPPPAVRPTRSTSLRQPSAAKVSGGAGETRGHARHRSQILSSQAISGATATSSREKSGVGSTAVVKQTRPQFTTFQQHFSPKKEAPRTGTVGDGKNTGKSVAGGELCSETAALQTEFLQLYLLHSSALRQNAEWRTAAERQLRDKYNDVAASYRTILAEERRVQERLNLEALYDWSLESAKLAEYNHGVGFQEEIQSFSRVTQEVADVIAEGAGRYALAVQVFEHWLDRVENILRSREKQSKPDGYLDADPQYIDSLGSVWRNEVDELMAKAELCLRELCKMTIFVIDEKVFSEKHGNSALVRIATNHRDLLVGMIDELKSMRGVESETVKAEHAWIARAADQVTIDQGVGMPTGIWRQ